MRVSVRSAATVAVVSTLLLLAAPASARVDAKSSSPSVSGTWSGTWERTSSPPTQGTMTLTLKQKGSSLSGSEKVVGSACLTTNDVSGTLKGSNITFGLSEANMKATYKATVSGSKMSGALEVKCGSLTGTGKFSLKRKS